MQVTVGASVYGTEAIIAHSWPQIDIYLARVLSDRQVALADVKPELPETQPLCSLSLFFLFLPSSPLLTQFSFSSIEMNHLKKKKKGLHLSKRCGTT